MSAARLLTIARLGRAGCGTDYAFVISGRTLPSVMQSHGER